MNENGRPVQTLKSIPFIEHILALLKEDGIAALVLPNGVFSSQGNQFRKIRELIWEKSELLAIIGLPHWVFFHTGCDVQGALLFLKRKDTPRTDYSIFIDWAKEIGYDAAGHKTETNDLPDILDRYQSHPWPRENTFTASDLQKKGRIDPLYYQPGDHQIVGNLPEEQSTPLTDLLVLTTEKLQRKRGNTQTVHYVEVGDTDKATGRIVNSTEYPVQSLPQRAKWIARENMLMIPNHRNSIRAGRSVTLVPAEWDGTVVTSRFIVARTTVPAIYLYHILNLEIVKQKMLTLVTGSSSTEIKFNELSEIKVPLPIDGDFDLWLEQIRDLNQEIEESRTRMEGKEQELRALMDGLYKVD